MITGERIICAAHRGDRAHYPENTLPAFQAAIELGCDMIETDIHMTKDGNLIILHDHSVKRTTNGDGYTSEMTLKEIKALDAGSWFDPKFCGVKVPTAEEFIESLRATDILVNWELKDYPSEVGDEFAFKTADKLIALLENNHLAEHSMLNSFSARVLEYIHDQYNGKYCLHGQGIYHCSKSKDAPVKNVADFFDWVCMYGYPGNPVGDKENYDYAIEHGILPCICIADVKEDYKKAVAYGVRMFTTNDPEKALGILMEIGERT